MLFYRIPHHLYCKNQYYKYITMYEVMEAIKLKLKLKGVVLPVTPFLLLTSDLPKLDPRAVMRSTSKNNLHSVDAN